MFNKFLDSLNGNEHELLTNDFSTYNWIVKIASKHECFMEGHWYTKLVPKTFNIDGNIWSVRFKCRNSVYEQITNELRNELGTLYDEIFVLSNTLYPE